MNMQELITEWDKDSKIDETELGAESTNIPRIHNKYMKLHVAEKINLKRTQYKMYTLKKMLTEYYSGELDETELEQLEYQQFFKRVDKKDLQLYIDSNEDYQSLDMKLVLIQEKVDYLERIMKSIGNRNWEIRNAIEWNRFTSGG